MATTEYTGVFIQIDGDGNQKHLYPEVKTDTTLSIAGKAADAAAVGEALEKASFTTDTTLSIAGKPADAKAVGERITVGYSNPDLMVYDRAKDHWDVALFGYMGYNPYTDEIKAYTFSNGWQTIGRGGVNDLYIIKDGAVVLPNADLYYQAGVGSSLCGVTNTSRTVEPSIYQNGHELVVTATKSASNGAWMIPVSVVDLLDLTEYNYVKMSFSIGEGYTGDTVYKSSLVVAGNCLCDLSVGYEPKASYTLLENANTYHASTAVIDVSSLSGVYGLILDLAMRPTSNGITLTLVIHDLWLEK